MHGLLCFMTHVLDHCVVLQWWCLHDPTTGRLRKKPYSGNLVNSADELEQATRFMLWVQDHCPGHTWRNKAAVLVIKPSLLCQVHNLVLCTCTLDLVRQM